MCQGWRQPASRSSQNEGFLAFWVKYFEYKWKQPTRTICSLQRATFGSRQSQLLSGFLGRMELRSRFFNHVFSHLSGVGEPAARGHEDSVWPGPERECLIEVKNHLQRRLNKTIMDISEPDFSLVFSFHVLSIFDWFLFVYYLLICRICWLWLFSVHILFDISIHYSILFILLVQPHVTVCTLYSVQLHWRIFEKRSSAQSSLKEAPPFSQKCVRIVQWCVRPV